MRGLSVIMVVALSSALTQNCNAENSLSWSDVSDAIKAMELQKFCANNPGHTRCREIEERRKYCNNNPNDERCKEDAASTVLFWCESTTLPYNLGMCDGTLGRYADQAATDVPEWKCVP